MTGLPASINHGTVTGKLLSAVQLPSSDADIDAVPLAGTVTFTLSVPRVIHAGSSSIIVPGPVTVTLDGAGAFTTKLIATNDPDLNPVGWTYLVSFALTGVTLASFSISLPADTTLDLSNVVSVPPSDGLLSHTHATADVTSGIFAPARLGSGTADSTKFLRGDSTWAAAGGSGVPGSPSAVTTREISGRYYNGTDQTTTTNRTIPRNLVCYPFSVSRDCTLDRIGLHVTTAGAGEVARLGIYTAGTNGLPAGTALLDAGTVSLAATGLAEATVSQALTAGVLYFLAVTHGATGSSALAHGDSSGVTQYGPGGFLGRDAPSGLPFTCIFRTGNSDAVLPDATGSSWTYATDYGRPYVRIA
jgi:hypothetical protein